LIAADSLSSYLQGAAGSFRRAGTGGSAVARYPAVEKLAALRVCLREAILRDGTLR